MRDTPLKNITRAVLAPLWLRPEIPTRTIAARLGVTRQGLSWKARALGLPPRTGNQKPNTKGDDDLFRRMWLFGVNATEMAAHFGYSHAACVSCRRSNMGLPGRPRGFRPRPIAAFWEAELGRRMARSVTR